MTFEEKIRRLPGPIIVLGASGFVGANLFRKILACREDVFAIVRTFPAWRLEGLQEKNILAVDLLVEANVRNLVWSLKPKTVFDCAAYGAYSFQNDATLIYETNIDRTVLLTEELMKQGPCTYIHAGSSSEYGDQASGPAEEVRLTPNSHYAVSKGAASGLLYYLGKKRKFACANLRFYSIYGPYEDSSRLIPNLVMKGASHDYPPFVSPDISRDFIYIDDACESFVSTALNLQPEQFGESFNIGSGHKTTIRDLALLAKDIFHIDRDPEYSKFENRAWDVSDWFANPTKIKDSIGWTARTSLREGLEKTTAWIESLEDLEAYRKSSKQFVLDTKHSISAIVACYKDSQAIPIMHERLVRTFQKLGVDYEIIFVNDNSPDNSEEIIQSLSQTDRHVVGISHSRNFGSQAAFRSGMEIATKNSCVLLDGDLQDPPELIEEYVQKWREGFDVVYGRRIKREATLLMQVAYKLFYYVFNRFSYIPIPRDAGDFSLIDKKVVRCILQFQERDFFLRGVRAYAGFKQVGVDYMRPERMFGRSTNSFFKNLGWAKKGLLSYSNTPLNALTFFGVVLFGLSAIMAVVEIVLKVVNPDIAPKGLTTVIVIVIFFGSTNLFGLSILGEYLGKVLEESKGRPHFIRRAIIKGGEIRDANQRSDI